MKNKSAIGAAVLCGALVLGADRAALSTELEPGRDNICMSDASCAEQLSRAAEFSKNKQLPEALAAYLAAYERRPYAPILFNIARLHHRLGQLDKAVQFYQRFIDAAPPDAAEQIEKARGYLEQAKRESAEPRTDLKTEPRAASSEAKPETRSETKTESRSEVKPAPLLAGTNLGPTADAALPLVPTKADKPPFYRRNWFWGLTGGVIGGSLVGIIVGIILRPRSLPDYATTIRFITPTGSLEQ